MMTAETIRVVAASDIEARIDIYEERHSWHRHYGKPHGPRCESLTVDFAACVEAANGTLAEMIESLNDGWTRGDHYYEPEDFEVVVSILGHEFAVEDVCCVECHAAPDARDGWLVVADERTVEASCPDCAAKCLAYWCGGDKTPADEPAEEAA